MPVILSDTDFLIKVTSKPLPAMAEFLESSGFQLVTLPKIVEELRGLALSKKPATARKARAALSSLENGGVKLLSEGIILSRKETDADALLIEFVAKSSNKGQVVVATLDHSLLSVLERRRLPYLTLRNDRPLYRSFE